MYAVLNAFRFQKPFMDPHELRSPPVRTRPQTRRQTPPHVPYAYCVNDTTQTYNAVLYRAIFAALHVQVVGRAPLRLYSPRRETRSAAWLSDHLGGHLPIGATPVA